MSDTTPTPQGDILRTQLGVDEPHNSTYSKLLEREPMEDTPFWIIGSEKEGYFATLGKYQLTEKFPTKDGVQNHIDTKVWDIVMKVVGIVASELITEHEKTKAKNPITNI